MTRIPPGWNSESHKTWLLGQRNSAIQQTLVALNASKPNEPRPLFVQLSYYAYLSGNYAEAARFSKATLERHGSDAEIEKNLSSALLRAGHIEEALTYALLSEQNATATPELLDTICNIYWRLDKPELAIRYGSASLEAKDKRARMGKSSQHKATATIPLDSTTKINVISFTLWGDHPRYLRGCLRNALEMKAIYPGWRMRLYAASDVPQDLLETLARLNVEVIMRDAKAPAFAKLSWRFEVANDEAVNRFQVRDADSVINIRESAAVAEWMDSGRSFHVMRDWTTHTDLILAGMWGGIAGLLPSIQRNVSTYKPRFMNTPNMDQWFLGDVIWPRIATDVLVHDRYYPVLGAKPFPGPALNWKNAHVGQDEFAVRPSQQIECLRDWATIVPSLKLSEFGGQLFNQ